MAIHRNRGSAAILEVLLVAGITTARAQDFEQVQIKTIPVSDNVYMLVGRGGNIGVSVGADGVFLIDDQYAPLTEKIRAAVAALDPGPIRFVLNTHWHSDHTGGNEALGKAGTLIVAHDNVRKRLTTEQFIAFFDSKVAPSPTEAVPVVTFNDAVTFHLNGDEILATHVAPAHTDGDAVVYFRKANVVHTGDLYFAAGYPFIDFSSGGSVDGVIAAVEGILNRIGKDTRVIPGHGSLSDRAGLEEYLRMLVTVRDRVKRQIENGKSLADVQAAKPTAEFDAGRKSWITPDRFVELVYGDLSRP